MSQYSTTPPSTLSCGATILFFHVYTASVLLAIQRSITLALVALLQPCCRHDASCDTFHEAALQPSSAAALSTYSDFSSSLQALQRLSSHNNQLKFIAKRSALIHGNINNGKLLTFHSNKNDGNARSKQNLAKIRVSASPTRSV
uniref:Uncharacterized protein n=1 Tax=Ditylum brightwellii TaxID=49249 RepID=A0A7S4S0J0_9STRA